MKARLTWLLPALAIFFVGSSSPTIAEDDTLLVIANPSVRASELSADQLVAIFTLSERHWPGGEGVVPFNFPPGSGPRERFDRAVLRMDPDEVARFWIDRRIRGLGDSPRKVPTAAILLRIVANVRGAIGYVPAGPLPGDVKLMARISGGKVMRVGE